MKGPIRVFEDKFDAVPSPHSVAERFRETPAEDIDPVDYVTITGIVIPDVDMGFVARLVGNKGRIFFVKK
ncbi:MAG TPA: hypothetical protein VLN58_01535 [Verrucomicrobiae bacterium]|nr:hypothetical protein [Verrucomicrobiae bacterium]